MIDLDEVERLARIGAERDLSRQSEEILARFILRALPLIRAAEDAVDKYDDQRCAIWLDSSSGERLVEAVNAFKSGDK